jgi:gluconate 5-dehydrogenase
MLVLTRREDLMHEWKPNFELDGRVVLVTGGSRGLGLAMSRALAASGATVVLNGRSAGPLEQERDAIRAAGFDADIEAFAVDDAEAAKAGIHAVAQRHGGLYGLVNNAGHQRRHPIDEMTDEAFEDVVAVHLTASFRLMREAVAIMRANPAGSVGRIVSTSSVTASHGRKNIYPYAAAKSGLEAMARVGAAEFGAEGITCNAIAPGYFLTEINTPLLDDKPFTEWVTGRTPAGRWADPSELGGAIAFLMSPASSFVNGQVLVVDGGMTAVL